MRLQACNSNAQVDIDFDNETLRFVTNLMKKYTLHAHKPFSELFHTFQYKYYIQQKLFIIIWKFGFMNQNINAINQQEGYGLPRSSEE